MSGELCEPLLTFHYAPFPKYPFAKGVFSVVCARLMDNSNDSHADGNGDGELKIYFLPNLFTAGNLFCGFLALTKIVGVDLDVANPDYTPIREALWLILLACVFDALDGRVARMGGYESPFGREFDSLADIVSFGVAPAFLVHKIVLKDVFTIKGVDHSEIGWFIASVYVICGALRLARFNCLAAMEEDRQKQEKTDHSSEFIGFPIPAAAGLVASITIFLMWMEREGYLEGYLAKGNWKFVLPVLLVFLSIMMVSKVKYPTFKRINLRGSRSFMKMVVAAVCIGLLFTYREKALPIVAPLIFIGYLVDGFVRPWFPHRARRDIEEDTA